MLKANNKGLASRRSGQIAIIALMMMAVFGVITTSVVTQVVYEQRRATVEQRTEQAYYAAEAGIEDALQKIRSNQTISGSVVINADDPDPNKRIQVQVKSQNIGGDGDIFESGSVLNSGEYLPLNLKGYVGNSIEVCWSTPSTPNNTAIQVVYYYQDASPTGAGQEEYFINPAATDRFRYAGTPPPSTILIDGSVPCSGFSDDGQHHYVSSGPIDLGPVGSKTRDFIAVWIWYGSVNNLVFKGDLSLPVQGQNLTATAFIKEQGTNVTRRISYFVSSRNYPPVWLLMGLAAGSFNFGSGRTW